MTRVHRASAPLPMQRQTDDFSMKLLWIGSRADKDRRARTAFPAPKYSELNPPCFTSWATPIHPIFHKTLVGFGSKGKLVSEQSH